MLFKNWRFKVQTEDGFAQFLSIMEHLHYYNAEYFRQFTSGYDYANFNIPKKHGGYRYISNPIHPLKIIQSSIASFFEIVYKPNDNAFGFIKKRSIVDNAIKHVGKDVVVNIDLKDFFNSIDYGKVIEKLIRQPYYFHYNVAKLIADLITVKADGKGRFLPQGTPSSPIFTNLIADLLDIRLSKLAEKHNMTYSRYADDITFSFNYSVYLLKWKKNRILKRVVFDIIESEGFTINKRKTRFAFKYNRQEVTGLTVNEKVNVKRSYIKNLRTELHNWEKDGYIRASYKFFKNYEQKKNAKDLPPMERVIMGKLSYVKMVKGKEDSTYNKLRERFYFLYNRDKRFFSDLSDV